MPAAKAFAGSAILNELSRTHIHTTYMYVYAGLVHIFLYIYIFNKWRKVHATPCNTPATNACNTLQHTCNKYQSTSGGECMQHPATHLQQRRPV